MPSLAEVKYNLERDGYYLFKNYFELDHILNIKSILNNANEVWLKENTNPKVINSAYLTSTKYLPNEKDLDTIFGFLSSEPILNICKEIFENEFYFLNTQIFFNPTDKGMRPYWHRDIQYLGIPEEEQIQRIQKDFVWHFRIPLEADPGLWFVPGSHNRWDTEEEREVRLEMENHRSHEPLPNQILIPHNPCDLLVFSAHLLHKAEYGKNRFSFDVLYTNFPESKHMVEKWNHFPNWGMSSFTNEQKKLFLTK